MIRNNIGKTLIFCVEKPDSLFERSKPFTDGELGKFRDTMRTEFCHNLLAMRLDSLDA